MEVVSDTKTQTLFGAYFDHKWGHLTRVSVAAMKLGPSHALALARALRGNAAIRWLTCFDNAFADAGATAIARALASNKTLTSLNLSCNGVGDDGASAFGALLATTSTLRELRLSFNGVTCRGAGALADALTTNASLTRLHLSYCPLYWSSNDAEAAGGTRFAARGTRFAARGTRFAARGTRFADALAANTTLTALHMCGSGIFDAEVELWAPALRVNTTLRELGLRRNSITDDGFAAIVLSMSPVLERLDVGANHIGWEGRGGMSIRALSLTLHRLPCLVWLAIDANDVTSTDALQRAWIAAGRPAEGLVVSSEYASDRSMCSASNLCESC